MKKTYKTKGTCFTEINFHVENGIIKEVKFTRGCNGNLSAIASLVKDMIENDLKLANKEKYLRDGGFRVMNYFE